MRRIGACMLCWTALGCAAPAPTDLPMDADSDTDSETVRGPCGGPLVTYEDELGPGGFIEYRAGTLPLVLAAPHGGLLEPDSLPVVDDGLSRDGGSLETTLLLREALLERTGHAPHVVINHVRRNRLNLNKSRWEEEPNAEAQAAIEAGALWDTWIDRARQRITDDCGMGAFVDMHTKAREVNIGIGMGIHRDRLNGPVAELDQAQVWEGSAVRSLAARAEDPVAAIRGPNSLGGLLVSEIHEVVPSPDRPGPGEEELYFWSGRNTWRHGSVDGGSVDGFHLEMHWEYINTTDTRRQETADALADAIVVWLETWYGAELRDG